MDSMTEMFYDESNGILRSMRKCVMLHQANPVYDQDAIMELFRGVHTLKADSAMMLYENMASVSKTLESLLYCFRGEGKTVENGERFTKVITSYIDYFEIEVKKLSQDAYPDGDVQSLEEDIREYTNEMTSKMESEEASDYYRQVQKKNRQVYYIASAVEDDTKESELSSASEQEGTAEPVQAIENDQPLRREDTISIKVENTSEDTQQAKQKYVITCEEREHIRQSYLELQRMVDCFEVALGQNKEGLLTREDLNRLEDILQKLEEVKKKLSSANFVPVAKKMEIVVDEMSASLDKPVHLSIKGEKTLVDPEKREKISSALIHIIRNAVDHGIEDMETRERLGKSPMGLIKLRFSVENGVLKITVKDDGGGIDTQKVLEAADKQHLLTKPKEEYKEKEIWDLVLYSGLTTSEKVGEYSGSGVGMDVINQNVKELGGKLKISSKFGLGTTVTMKFY